MIIFICRLVRWIQKKTSKEGKQVKKDDSKKKSEKAKFEEIELKNKTLLPSSVLPPLSLSKTNKLEGLSFSKTSFHSIPASNLISYTQASTIDQTKIVSSPEITDVSKDASPLPSSALPSLSPSNINKIERLSKTSSLSTPPPNLQLLHLPPTIDMIKKTSFPEFTELSGQHIFSPRPNKPSTSTKLRLLKLITQSSSVDPDFSTKPKLQTPTIPDPISIPTSSRSLNDDKLSYIKNPITTRPLKPLSKSSKLNSLSVPTLLDTRSLCSGTHFIPPSSSSRPLFQDNLRSQQPKPNRFLAWTFATSNPPTPPSRPVERRGPWWAGYGKIQPTKDPEDFWDWEL